MEMIQTKLSHFQYITECSTRRTVIVLILILLTSEILKNINLLPPLFKLKYAHHI